MALPRGRCLLPTKPLSSTYPEAWYSYKQRFLKRRAFSRRGGADEGITRRAQSRAGRSTPPLICRPHKATRRAARDRSLVTVASTQIRQGEPLAAAASILLRASTPLERGRGRGRRSHCPPLFPPPLPLGRPPPPPPPLAAIPALCPTPPPPAPAGTRGLGRACHDEARCTTGCGAENR